MQNKEILIEKHSDTAFKHYFHDVKINNHGVKI